MNSGTGKRKMLLVDGRAGSKELEAPLVKLFGRQLVEKTTLEFGDIAFAGKGAEGRALEIGIEYKKLGEMVTSIRDGRFSGHQLPGMLGDKGMYDYGWLVIEGDWRIDREGFMTVLQVRRGQRPEWKRLHGNMPAAEYKKHLLTYALCGGIYVEPTTDQADTLRFLSILYHWWTDRALDEHTSHLTVHQPNFLGSVSDFRQAIMKWPGIGLKMSKAVEDWTISRPGCERSVAWVATRNIKEWADVRTIDKAGNSKRFGEASAKKLVDFLTGVK